jgi:hypothetical protein
MERKGTERKKNAHDFATFDDFLCGDLFARHLGVIRRCIRGDRTVYSTMVDEVEDVDSEAHPKAEVARRG